MHEAFKGLWGALLLAAATGCASNPARVQPQIPTREEDVAQTPEQPKTLEERLRILTRMVEELRAEVGQLRSPRPARPNDLKLWP